ncbi:MAG: hypothetical protein PWP04_1324 [Candidatus Atribacteria bacterium]|nr:hypothetical protein [Candidatus Atribacteria bacterium]
MWKGDPNGFWVVFWADQIVAFIGVHGSWLEKNGRIGEIHELVVCPEYQGKGLATALLEKAFSYCVSLGRRKIGLWVGEKNQPAIRLYLKAGFVRTGQWGKWIRMKKEVI